MLFLMERLLNNGLLRDFYTENGAMPKTAEKLNLQFKLMINEQQLI